MAKKVKLENLKVKSFLTTTDSVKGGFNTDDTEWGQGQCTETACFCY